MSILRVAGAAVVGIVAGMQTVAAAHAETRVALVIGNGAYENVPHLTNPTNDAKLIADALHQDRFEVTLVDDLDRDGLAKALRTFGQAADNADWAVIYYAGHGIEMGGINYLIPVDARLEKDRDVGLEAVPLDEVMSAIGGARALRLVILDACRTNPFATKIKHTEGAGRAIGRGLARVEPAQATLVAYSAKDGSEAEDGDGADSPYAMALAKHLTDPGVEVDRLFRRVRDDVEKVTGRNQEPFTYGSLPGDQDFYFEPPAAAIATPAVSADEAAWQRIASSTDPVDFESFGRFFPDSAHKAEAEAKAQSLRTKAEPKAAVLEPEPPSVDDLASGQPAAQKNAPAQTMADEYLNRVRIDIEKEDLPKARSDFEQGRRLDPSLPSRIGELKTEFSPASNPWNARALSWIDEVAGTDGGRR
jgi:Caspase domain